MKLRFSDQEQIEESFFEDIEYEIHDYSLDTAFIVDDEENHHMIIDLMTDGLEFAVYN
ncbi:hypothetical protein NFB56_16045 [Yersinia ruckeri]|uniref:hypothetical protein n=1 Tax=Yersinia ruckeri TaxID=29486 RepID=UPI002238294E|nr:hypothetical protein [Yersinia ruckeri]MCW6550350.1 hypothetical protein [Yersinia ruckeri]